ncbi:hypothetical protein HOY82DRAFT_53778 [Tuber indicum]|nr:hypothetical protein HOY82DRAFT_53778 [Tuber indicum]
MSNLSICPSSISHVLIQKPERTAITTIQPASQPASQTASQRSTEGQQSSDRPTDRMKSQCTRVRNPGEFLMVLRCVTRVKYLLFCFFVFFSTGVSFAGGDKCLYLVMMVGVGLIQYGTIYDTRHDFLARFIIIDLCTSKGYEY